MLTEKRAADRRKMADELTAAMVAVGATVTESPRTDYAPRRIALKILVPNGPYIGVDFDGDTCQPDVHVATWNVELDSVYGFYGDHGSKMTRVCHGFADLVETLRGDVIRLSCGAAYSPDRTRQRATESLAHIRRGHEYLAPIVAAGLGTVYQSGEECEPADVVKAKYEAQPAKIAALEAFIAAGCPMNGCSGVRA